MLSRATFDTARRVFQTQGVRGVLSAVKDRYGDNWAGRQLDWWYGKLVELRGNVVQIDGCTFGLECPAISTESKSKFMLDRYERPERMAVREFVDPELPVVELGGAIGVIACLTNRRLRRPQDHVVVEANPALVPLLLSNRDRNQCAFRVLQRVVAYGAARALFYPDKSNFVIGSAVSQGSAGEDATRAVEVATTNLRDILETYAFDRCTLVCDIEGGESDLIRHERDVLARRVSTLIMEMHPWVLGEARVRELWAEIEALGFRTLASDAETYTFQMVR